MNAVTANEEATIAAGPLRSQQSVEPLSDYTVVRARREFANQSTVGFMVTGVGRQLDAFTSFLPRQAFTGGVDWDWRLNSRYAIQGYWVGSDISGTAAAIQGLQESTVHSFQRPDADHVEEDVTRTSLTGDGPVEITNRKNEEIQPDFIADNLFAAVEKILKEHS